MRHEHLEQYAAVVTGLFLDVLLAAALGWLSEMDAVGIAFGGTLLFIIGYAGTLLALDALGGRRPSDGKDGRAVQKSARRAVRRHLPYPIWQRLAYREWEGRRRAEARRRTEPQIYTLTGDVMEVRSNDDRDMMEIVPVWTARREELH